MRSGPRRILDLGGFARCESQGPGAPGLGPPNATNKRYHRQKKGKVKKNKNNITMV